MLSNITFCILLIFLILESIVIIGGIVMLLNRKAEQVFWDWLDKILFSNLWTDIDD